MQSVGRVGSLSGESPDTRPIAKDLAGQRFACHLPPSVGLSGRGLVTVPVPEDELLAVGRVIHGVGVEGQLTRRGVEGSDGLAGEDVAQPFEGLAEAAFSKRDKTG